MQRIEIIGNLAMDAQEIQKKDGDSFVSMVVIVNQKYGDREVKNSYECHMNKTGVLPFLKSGKKVFIEGTPSPKYYTNKENETVAQIEINVGSIELL